MCARLEGDPCAPARIPAEIVLSLRRPERLRRSVGIIPPVGELFEDQYELPAQGGQFCGGVGQQDFIGSSGEFVKATGVNAEQNRRMTSPMRLDRR